MAGTLVKEIAVSKSRCFTVVIYDLLYEPVDCIVNPANGGLSHGGGVAAAIVKAAGPKLEAECDAIVREKGRVPVGEAVLTSAGKLPFKGIIHTVGPRMGDGNEEQKIVAALRSAFFIADAQGWVSLSFPGISSGIFGVPYPLCAKAYVRAVRECFRERPDSSLKTIRLCLLKGPLLEAVKRELK